MTLEKEVDIDPMRSLSLQDFSYSRLNTFKQCELQYYYSYVLKEPQEFGHPAKLGNILHTALEVTLEHGQKISLAELMDNYRASIESWDPESKIPLTMIDDGVVMLQEFVRDHPDEVNLYAKELPFSFVLGPARFNGFIDLVSVHDSYVRVRDYKSGKATVPYKDVPTNLQLGIYALYVKSLFPDLPVRAELYYLRTGKARGHLFTDDDLKQVEDTLINMVQTVLTMEDFKPTDNPQACRWCSYGKSGLCSTGWRRLNPHR